MVERTMLTAEARAAFDSAVECFDDGRYHEALDLFEVPYHHVARRNGQLYLGLIRASAALYHFAGGRWTSARRLYRSSRDVLSTIGHDAVHGVDLAAIIGDLDQCFAMLVDASDEEAALLRPTTRPRIVRRMTS